jgi:hypothetical protein
MIELCLFNDTATTEKVAEHLDGMTTVVWETLYERASRDAHRSK